MIEASWSQWYGENKSGLVFHKRYQIFTSHMRWAFFSD